MLAFRPSSRLVPHWLAAVVPALATHAQNGIVRTVDDDGPSDHATVQAALDASSDGDTIVVRPGAYAGFHATGKALAIVGLADASGDLPTLTSKFTISAVPSTGTFVVDGFRAVVGSGAGLDIDVSQCAGTVVLQRIDAHGFAQSKLAINGCSAVVVSDSAFVPGRITCAASMLQLYATTAHPANTFAETALGATSSTVLLEGCALTGGPGWIGASGLFCSSGGPGAAGISLTDSEAWSLECNIQGGSGGSPGTSELGGPPCGFGPSGPPVSGSGFHALAGTAHRLVASSYAQEGAGLAVLLDGEPGEHVFALLSASTAPALFLQWSGALVPAQPWVVAPLGVLPASGTASFVATIGELGPLVEASVLHAQPLFVNAAGQGPDFLGSPASIVLLDRAAPLVDCNANDVDDDEDIAQATSTDADADGVPDECQGVLVVPSATFPTIASAVAAAQSGSTIRLLDGVYSGAGNHDVTWIDKDLRIESANGAALCTIDCQGAGRALWIKGGAGGTSILRGITFRGGDVSAQTSTGFGGALRAQDASLDIEDCVFVDNAAVGGGAMSLAATQTQAPVQIALRGCTLRDNSAGSAGAIGGGASPQASLTLLVQRCRFDKNVATAVDGGGGAIATTYTRLELRDCELTRNAATVRGGALYALFAPTAASADWVALRNCTIADNRVVLTSAFGLGGAICAFPFASVATRLVMRDSVMAGNRAPKGAGIFASGSTLELDLAWCDVHGGPASIALDPPSAPAQLVWGPGMLVAKPQFVNAPGGDFHLAPGSPCIDAGDPAFVVLPNELDIDGEPRVNPPRVDIGADERY